jgi:predicted RNase H-like HicB family nuclease
MKYSIECEREEDGRWLAEVPELPGVMAYGSTPEETQAKAQVLALRVLAERLEHGGGAKRGRESLPACRQVRLSIPSGNYHVKK